MLGQAQQPAPMAGMWCEPCPAASPHGWRKPPQDLLVARAVSQPAGPDPSPAHPSQASGAVALCVSCDGFQTLLRFCSHGRAGDASPMDLPPHYLGSTGAGPAAAPPAAGGVTTSPGCTGSWRGGRVSRRGTTGGRAGAASVGCAGLRLGVAEPSPCPVVGTRWGRCQPRRAGQGTGLGATASSGLSAWGPAGPPVPCWAL